MSDEPQSDELTLKKFLFNDNGKLYVFFCN